MFPKKEVIVRRLANMLTLVGLLTFLALVACSQEETSSAKIERTGVVTATQAYLSHFGTPPQGKAGQAFARVGYLPLKKDPQRVRPFPLFLFSENEQLRQMLERLVSGDLHLPKHFGLYHPFPERTEVMTTPLGAPLVTISLMTHSSWSEEDMQAGGLALAETALQFPGVKQVVVMLNGQPLAGMPDDGYYHQPQRIAKVVPPGLVLIAGMWEKGTGKLDELLVEFDRPIKVNSFKLSDSSGQPVEGDLYTSIFQMAVVIHPQNPEIFLPGTILTAEWNIVDELGRVNKGTTSLPLQRFEH